MNSKKKDKNQNIKVFVRIRPTNASEKQQKTSTVVELSSSKELKVNEKSFDKMTKTFTFDHVFGPTSKQIDVYNTVVSPMINEVLSGYNCTVFAYGQTGTGKTFTMLGEKWNAVSSWQTDPLAGVIPRAVGHLIDELRMQDVEYTIRVSFLELYNEELFDLLSPIDDSGKIRLFEDANKKGSVIINGLEEITVHNKNEVFSIMDRGTMKRQTAATLMNANSSRSHTVFSITVHMREKAVDDEELLKTGKLNLVDLAGSENIGRSGAVEKRAREAGNINQSLLTLGRVITALVEHAPHIPYRESKLTRLLQDSLGGRTKTSIIATVSPASSNLEETLSTLEYAHRAKNIQNRPEVNEKRSKLQLIKEYTEEIDRLRRDLLATRERNGVYIALENYQDMIKQLELDREEINEKLQLIKILEKKKLDMETLCSELNISLEETKVELIDSKRTLMLAAEVVEEQLEREKELTTQAHTILAVANVSTVDAYKLHDKLDRKRSVEEENSRISQDFRIEFNSKITHMQENFANFVNGHTRYLNELSKQLDESAQKRNTELSTLSEDIASFVEKLTNTLQTWSKVSSEEVGAAQRNTQKLLQDARSIMDTETNVIHNFLTDSFLPVTQNLQHQLLLLKAENEGFSRLVNEQAQRNIEIVQMFATTHLETISQFRESLIVPIKKMQQMTERIQKDYKNKAKASEKYNEELISNLQKVIEIVRNTETKHQEFITQERDGSLEVEDSLKLIHQNAEKAILLTNSPLQTGERQCRDLCANIELQGEETTNIVKGFLQRTAGFTNDIEESHNEVETAVRGAVSSTEAAWSRRYSFFEQQLRGISENIRDIEIQHQDHTQLLAEGLHKAAHSHDAHVEEQQVTYSNFIRDQITSVEQQCTRLSDWSRSVDSDIQGRGRDVEELLVEIIRQDVPTGITPQRREYNYPNSMVSSTPSRIIEKLHKIHEAAQLKDKLEKVSEDAEIKSDNLDSIPRETSSESSTHTENNLSVLGSNEDVREETNVKLQVTDSSASGTPYESRRHGLNKSRLSQSVEAVNKENQRADDAETTKIAKSGSLNDLKVTQRKALNIKN